MKCEIHPDQTLIPAIKPFKGCIVSEGSKHERWEYVCPLCRELHFHACQKEYGHKFPSE